MQTNNTITEIKNTLEGINSRISETLEQVCELENEMVEINSEELNKLKIIKRTEDSLRDVWDNIKHTDIRIIGVSKEVEKKNAMRKFLKRLQLKISRTWKRK